MEVDTVLKFVGQDEGCPKRESGAESECSTPSKTLEIMAHMGRFLAPTHQILVDLKLRFISQIEMQVHYNIQSLL